MLPLYVVITALLASLSLTPVATRLALLFGVVDVPGPRKVHLVPMPLWGGLAMYGGTTVAVALFAGGLDAVARVQILGIGAGASLLVLVGSLDDGGLLHHQIKLMVAMPLATAILIAAGVHATVFTAA